MQIKITQGNHNKAKGSQCKNCVHTQKGYNQLIKAFWFQARKNIKIYVGWERELVHLDLLGRSLSMNLWCLICIFLVEMFFPVIPTEAVILWLKGKIFVRMIKERDWLGYDRTSKEWPSLNATFAIFSAINVYSYWGWKQHPHITNGYLFSWTCIVWGVS